MQMTRHLTFAIMLAVLVAFACTPDSGQEPSTNINTPVHIDPQQPADSTDIQVPADTTGTQQPADTTGTTDPVDPVDPDPTPDSDPTPDPEEDPAVDLGLSVKWASCNLGATVPEEFGDYYAWAEIAPYYESLDPLTWKAGKPAGYGVASYRWYGNYPNVTKYCPAELTNCWDKEGDPDGNTVIDPDDDAATVTLGSAWRIPTEADWKELISGCTWTWATHDGVNGFEISATNGASIFLPAAGMFDVQTVYDSGSLCAYWTSDLNTNLPNNAVVLHYTSGYGFTGSTLRYHGCTIRPVK